MEDKLEKLARLKDTLINGTLNEDILLDTIGDMQQICFELLPYDESMLKIIDKIKMSKENFKINQDLIETCEYLIDIIDDILEFKFCIDELEVFHGILSNKISQLQNVLNKIVSTDHVRKRVGIQNINWFILMCELIQIDIVLLIEKSKNPSNFNQRKEFFNKCEEIKRKYYEHMEEINKAFKS